ncbi:hypothetical protein LguiA_000139 [Lonicera macranthoides]
MDSSCNGFSSPRTDAFPAGLRVLVVDDDPTWLKILEKMLKKCSYEVTTCGLATEALDLLRERKDGFDIVISDVNMPDMDGFKLLEHVGLEMDLPVIMMSVDGETSRVMKGVQHGACDYLLKPIRMKELRNIWQHVFRKKIHEVRDIESHEGIEEFEMMRNGSDQSDDGYFLCGGDLTLGKKRKEAENKQDEKDYGDPSSLKKARVVWTVDLHQKFVKAVNQIGFDKVGPKKILDLMNVPWLTRENVASHLQKYRLYLSRLQKENDLKASFGGIKHSDLLLKDPAGCSLQHSINMPRIDSNYLIPTNILVQNANPKAHECDLTNTVSLPINGDNPEPQKTTSSRMGFNHSFGSLDSNMRFSTFDSTIPTQYSWSGEVKEIQFKQEHKPHQLENSLNHLALPSLQHHIQVNNIESPPSSLSPKPFNKESDNKLTHTENKLPYATKYKNQTSQGGNTTNLFSMQSESHTTNFHPFEPITSTTWNMKNQHLDHVSVNELESPEGNLILGKGSAFSSLDEDLHAFLLRGHLSSSNLGLQNKEVFECNNPELIAEVPPYLYDALRFDYEHPCDSIEYPVIDEGLFIA